MLTRQRQERTAMSLTNVDISLFQTRDGLWKARITHDTKLPPVTGDAFLHPQAAITSAMLQLESSIDRGPDGDPIHNLHAPAKRSSK